jgi:glycosyltransferase involved in cell wall biosynthesis
VSTPLQHTHQGADAAGRVRVAYVIKSMVVGGSQTHLAQVLRRIDRSRFDPVLYCLTNEGVLLDDVRAAGIPVFAPAAGASFRGAGLMERVVALRAAFRRHAPDIVHNYLLRANLVGSVSARLAGVPVVLCSKRGCHERRGFELIGARIGNFLADCVPVNAEAVREFVHHNESCPLEKMVVIPSGIDTERFRPLAAPAPRTALGVGAERRVVGIVTRMRVRKGVEEFIRAIGLVHQQRPDVHAVIVGEVVLDETLQRLVRELGLESHLTLLGRRSDMPAVYAGLDLFVLSSHDEGMSNAILEAMAMTKPVVATDVGGTAEVVQQGRSGLLVPPKDPTALATAILEVLAQPSRAQAMGQLGRQIVEERFSAHAMVRQMEQLYLNLMARRGIGSTAAVRTAA